jgi:putative transposase
MISFKGRHFKKTIILMAIRWYLAYSLSYRDIEELMAERGVDIDHSTVNRWVIKYSPSLEAKFTNHYKKKMGTSWRMDETYIKVKGKWCYLYRAVDKLGDTIDFMLAKNRDLKAAKRFFNKAIGFNGQPDKVTIDKSGSNNAALKSINKSLVKQDKIEIRQIKYLNNIIEQDHRFIKRITKPMMGFKSFNSAYVTIVGIELHHMLRKSQHVNSANSPVVDKALWLYLESSSPEP